MKTMVKTQHLKNITDILNENDYKFKEKNGLLFVKLKDYDVDVTIAESDKSIYFELDLVGLDELNDSKELYKNLLDLNTTILPVSFGINSEDSENSRLVLVDSLATENLDENEFFEILDVMEINLRNIFNILKNT